MSAGSRFLTALHRLASSCLRARTLCLGNVSRSPWRTFATLLSAAACSAVVAQNLPDNIRIIAPYPAGGPIDVMARVLAQELGQKLGRPVVVENRVGAGGNIGTDFAAKAAPDGSVLVLGSQGPLAVNKLLYKNLPYDPEKDLAPISFLGETPMIVVVKKSSPYARLGELLRDVRSGQAPLNFGSPGNGTAGHLTLELLRANAKGAFNVVTYKGGAPVIADVLKQVLDGGIDGFTLTAASHARSGSLRILAITSAERIASAPEVPTAVEEGFPQLRTSLWFALVGPKGLPKEFIGRVNGEVNAYLASATGVTRLQSLGIHAQPAGPDAVAQRMRDDLAKWAPIIRERGIQLQ